MIGNLLKLFFWRYLRAVMAKLPIPVLDGFIFLFSFIQVSMSGSKRKILAMELVKSGLARENSFPWKLVYRSYRNQNNRWIKKCLLSEIHSDNVDRYLTVQGIENLDKALSRGNGAIMLNPHFGPFLFALPALGYRGYPVHQVSMMSEKDILGKREGLRKLVYEAKFQSIEGRMPANFINAAGNPMVIRTVMKKLKEKGVVFFSSTGRGGKSWQKVDFLNRNASFSLAPFRLAIKMGVPIMPVFALDSTPVAKIVIEPPLDIPENGTPETLLETYASRLSSFISNHPDHFGYFLYEMYIKSWKDDHPFFDDYPERDRTTYKRTICRLF